MIFENIRGRLQKKWQSYMDEYGMIDIKIQEVFVEIRNIINQVETEYNNGWIPCSERLPEDDSTVWVTYINYGKELTATAYYDLESGYWYIGYFDYKTKSVTHWQPLPQPPKI